MDRLPNDVLARVFSHLPTLDLGRIMSVSRSWNTLLSTSPKLWINVNLPSTLLERRSTGEALKILEVFSNWSQSTLEIVILPCSLLKNLEVARVIQLLEPSRANLKKLALAPLDYSSPAIDLMDFVSRCPQLEELDLTGDDRGGEQVETSPGVLTHFSCFDLNIVPEDHQVLLRNLRFLQVIESGDSLILEVLSTCSESLQYLTLCGEVLSESILDEFQEEVSTSLHQLKALRIESSLIPWTEKWDSSALTNLEELGINPEYHAGVGPFAKLLKLHLLLPYFSEDREDCRLEWLQSMIDIVGSHQGTLQILSFSGWSGAGIIRYSIDQFLEFLRVNLVLGAPCPNLKELHLPKEFDFSATLLAEVLLSRRLLSKGYSILGPEGNEDDVHGCSEVVLFLDQENQEGFKEAEREVLSRCSGWMREAAGKTILRTLSLNGC